MQRQKSCIFCAIIDCYTLPSIELPGFDYFSAIGRVNLDGLKTVLCYEAGFDLLGGCPCPSLAGAFFSKRMK